MTATDFLKLRGRTWYVRVQIPPNLWATAGGKREYVKTLKTGDLNEANRLKHAYVASFKRQIAALERRKVDPLVDVYDKALAFRDAIEKQRGQILFYEGDDKEKPYYATDEFLSQIGDEARELLDTHGDKVADNFFKDCQGRRDTFTGPHRYLAH